MQDLLLATEPATMKRRQSYKKLFVNTELFHLKIAYKAINPYNKMAYIFWALLITQNNYSMLVVGVGGCPGTNALSHRVRG